MPAVTVKGNGMPTYRVEHIQGVQGYGEKVIELFEHVSAFCAMDAIRKVTKVSGWTAKDHGDTASLFNPEAPNRSEEYCDYYWAELQE